ncbi:DUF4129 domain-containing protein [Kitasatospora sp. NPDC088346]|uniref:DUF4129 domain-containing protein n=1 Tax=Kitasatospora sp. NPDC088346 TaxID=3364073 RepID=UPI00382968B6
MPNWGEGVLLASGTPVTVPRDPARDAARDELLNPIYHRNDPGLIERIQTWLSDRLDDLFSGVGSATDSTTGVVLLLLMAAVAVAAIWWRLGAPRRRARGTTRLFEADGPRSAAQHRAAARAHADAGEWSEAVREQMRALVRALEERTLLDIRPGRTADEAAAEAGRALPGHAEALAAAARSFDDIAYGDRTAGAADYQSLAELDRALEATRPTLAPAVGGAA